MSYPTAWPTARAATTWSRLALILALLVATLLSATPGQADAAALMTPAKPKVSVSTTTTLTITWKAVAKAENYRLQYSTSSKMKKAKYQREETTSGTLTGLKKGTTYYVKVRVIDADGKNLSAYSKAVKVKTPKTDPKPTEPTPTPTPPPTPSPTPSPSSTPSPSPTAKAEPLRAASYNIKCATCNSHALNEGTWEERRQAVVDTILRQHLDVVGLQEAGQAWLKDADGNTLSPSVTQFEDLTKRLGGSWELTNKNRNNCVKSTTPTHCVYQDQGASQDTKIIFDSSRVELLDQGSKQLSFVDADDNDRYVAWAQFRQISTGNRFMFASTHLEGTKDKAGSTAFHDLRKKQAEEGIGAVDAHNPDHLPVMFVGDFNSSRFAHSYSPTNAPYDVMVKAGLIDPAGGAFGTTKTAPGATVVKRIHSYVDTFNEFNRTVNMHKDWINGSTIDYIFISPSIKVPEWETVVNMDANGDFIGTIPSDHNMIRVSVTLPKTS